jgi:PAS domain S-box-containing protein
MKKISLLYIEDDAGQRILLTKELRQRGFTVNSVGSGTAGLKRLKSRKVDAVLCDLNMPRLSGLEVLKRINKLNLNIPFIILTRHGTVSQAVMALRMGAHDFILKPADPDEIENTVHKAIKQKSLEKEVLERTKSYEDANKTLRIKAKELEKATVSLGKANVKLFETQEALEQRNAEMGRLLHQLSQSKDELQAVLDASFNGIIMVNEQDQIISTNKQIDKYFGIESEKFIGKPFDSFLKKSRTRVGAFTRFERLVKKLKHEPDSFDSSLVDPHKMYEREIALIKPASRIVSVLCSYVFDRNEKTIGRVWIFVDITRAKLADEQLHTLVDASPIPFIISRINDGKILYANKPLGELLGLNASKMIGMKTPDFYANPDDRRIVVERIREDGHLYHHEVQIKRADGTIIWMILSLVATELSGEKVAVGALYDISQRRKAEDELRKERNFVSAVLDTAGALVVVLDLEGTIIRFNRACEEITGYSFKEVVNKKFWNIFLLPEEVDIVTERFLKLREGKSPVNGENHWLTKSGEMKLIAWSNSFLRNNEGEVEFVIATGIDITDRKRAQRALQESEERFRNLVENANDIIYSLTPEGVFTYVSPNWKSILGHDISEVLGKSFVPFVHPDDLDDCFAFLKKTMESGEKQSGIEYRVKHKNGTWRWHTTSASPFKDKDGDILYFIGIAHDITDRKKVLVDLEEAYRNLRQTQAQLVQSEKMASLGMLVAGIAHEINTPVGAINSMHDTLVRAVDKLKGTVNQESFDASRNKDKLKAAFDLIEDANRVILSGTDRVMNIVRRLRSFARLDEAELKESDIHEGLEDTLTLVHHELKHTVEVTKNYGKVPPISCFPGRLNQVFLNILINAKQAIKKEKGKITINTYKKDKKVYIEFEDNGVGIPKDKLKKIFDPGYTTKGVGIGTGLGLSICYQIMKDHHGEILVESEVGKGSKFTIVFPTNLDEILEIS